MPKNIYDDPNLWNDHAEVKERLKKISPEDLFVYSHVSAPPPCCLEISTVVWFGTAAEAAGYIKHCVRRAIADWFDPFSDAEMPMDPDELFRTATGDVLREAEKIRPLWECICALQNDRVSANALQAFLAEYNKIFSCAMADHELQLCPGLPAFCDCFVQHNEAWWEDEDKEDFLIASREYPFRPAALRKYLDEWEENC